VLDSGKDAFLHSETYSNTKIVTAIFIEKLLIAKEDTMKFFLYICGILSGALLFTCLQSFADITSNSKPVVRVQDNLAVAHDPQHSARSDEEMINAAMIKIYQAQNKEEQDRAIAAVQQLVDQENATAAFRLGRYFHLEARAPDYARAYKNYRLAMNKGNGWAINNIGLMYEEGKGFPVDINKAIEFYKLSTQQGDYHGFTNLARLYFTGQGVKRDPVAAQSWLDKGMKAGLVEVYKEASAIYYYGKYGVPVDFSKSLGYEEAAGNLGDNESEWMAGKMYLDGIGTRQDTNKAIAMFTKLADKNDAKALNSLGAIHANGEGVPVDKHKAVSYWERAAALHNCTAMRNLSGAYHNGWGVQVDEGKATEYARDAANCGNPPDGFDVWSLGTRYRDGVGIARNCTTAQQLFNRAIMLDYLDAITDIGFMYQNGCEEIQPDQKEAFKYYLAGAKLGVVLCQNNVGAMLKHGYGVDAPDRVKAFAWLTLAAENGNEVAKRNLQDFGNMFSDTDREAGLRHLEIIKKMVKTSANSQTFTMDASY
jgi:TPR repeat protein